MKKKYCTFVILGVILGVLTGRLSFAQEQQDVSGSVEIFIQGRRYESIRAYRRQKIKERLQNALSFKDLTEFSEDELCEIIHEVRGKKIAVNPSPEDSKSSSQPITEEDVQDLSAPQMQEMLKDYLKEHKEAKPLWVDPDKVKSIIIEDQSPPEDAAGE